MAQDTFRINNNHRSDQKHFDSDVDGGDDENYDFSNLGDIERFKS